MDFTDLHTSGAWIIGLSDCGEKLSAAGGRISTQEGTALGIWQKSQDEEKNQKLIDKVTRSGHNSVIEHTYYNLVFQNVSAAVEQFIIEFRLASFTVKSRRYVDFSDAGFYVPAFETEAETEAYKAHMASLFSLYTEFCEQGVPKEDARFLLPYCLYSNFFCSLNAREFLHMLRAMLFGRGKRFPEIYNLGLSLYEQAKARTPGILTGFYERAPQNSDVPNLSFLPKAEREESTELTELLAYTPDAESCVARSALIAETGLSTAQINAQLEDTETVDKIIRAVTETTRPRALESAVFTIRFNGVSLSGTTHFARHRMQSISIPSLCDTDRRKYIIPQSVRENPALLKKYEAAFEKNAAEYERLKKAGCPEETLLYYLLSGNTLDLVTTMNARELMLFMRLRTCTRAQWEIRAHAVDALKKLRKAAPGIFKYCGPSCYVSKCPEGKFSCGRANEMRELFENLK